MSIEDVIQFADDRPTSCDDILYQWAVDAEGVIRNLAAMVGAQQPAPSAASKAVLAAIRAANMQLVRTGDDEFMLVTYKNAKAQCDGGKCGIGGYCDDCPTPQADSQPAPTNTRQIAECYGDCPTDPKTCANPCKFEGRAAHAPTDSVCYDYAKQIAESMWATHYKADAPHWESCDSLMGVLSQISNMMCGLSRAPADSVTAPAGGAVMEPTPVTDADVRDMSARVISGQAEEDELVAFFERLVPPRPVRITQAADSVLEDAARYRYLRDGDWREHEKLESVIRLQLNALWDETIDAAMNKGGA